MIPSRVVPNVFLEESINVLYFTFIPQVKPSNQPLSVIPAIRQFLWITLIIVDQGPRRITLTYKTKHEYS